MVRRLGESFTNGLWNNNFPNFHFHFHAFFIFIKFSLPAEIYRDEFNYSNNQHEIRSTILNLYGIDVGLYPPMKAFEVIVGMEIRKLAAPVKTCVDLVIQELSNAVRTCTQLVSDNSIRLLILITPP